MLSLYRNKYITDINRWRKDKTLFRKDQIYERLWAIEKGHILWTDIPPGFEDQFNLPHRNDYGIDTLNLEYTETGQVKMYGPKSRISWTDICKYVKYSEVLGINKLNLLTTIEPKIDKMALKLFNPESIQRESFDSLLSRIPENIIIEEKIVVKQIEDRPYLLNAIEFVSNSQKEILKIQKPCGAGKTFFAAKLIGKNSGIYLFVVPWISLANQTVETFKSLGICCGLIGDGNTEIDKRWDVIVCITQSLHHLPKEYVYRIKFGDEGHHLEEHPEHPFFSIPSEKTILLSATFHNTKNVDFIVSKRELIDAGDITDYKINLQYYTGKRSDAIFKMVKENADWAPMFIYFNSTKKAKDFSKLLLENNITSEFLIGKDSDKKREKIKDKVLNELLTVVCLCGVWNEGESIDNLRTIIFGDLRHSSINLRQVSQRGSRKHHSKPFYNIVLPIEKRLLEDDDDDEDKDDLRKILRVFVDEDPILKKRIIKRSYSQFIIKLNNELIKEKEEEDETSLLYNKIFNSLGELINDSRLSVDQKIDILLTDNKIFPKGKEDEKFPDGVSKAIFWSDTKMLDKCLKQPYDRLLSCPVYKEDWDRYQKEKDAKLTIVKLSPDQKIDILLTDNKIFPVGKGDEKFTDGTSKASFWRDTKMLDRCLKKPYDRLLSCPVYKEDWERYQQEKLVKLTIDQKIDILLKDNKIFPHGKGDEKFPDGVSKARFWTDTKNLNRCLKQPYDRLLSCPVYKEDWDRYQKEKLVKL